ncbi:MULTISPECIES: metallophosphoesterase [Alphaproteobacteria]|uniref:Phosphatase n=2 Tax=Alphaproteobacteria TaxID=28211 RepID=A0A512HFR8_9HYPH|nr:MULTISPECIES: metallophosphoesterase [Alphaproteobacteria]GEO84295.1 phosphatase [Ciceribacter naphthalenivorans]GLR24831.1 phosphatase [Ciceribacter naphthalenivorans]GLT07687.1 phosphatase [Sphingomonas psychrolutea]
MPVENSFPLLRFGLIADPQYAPIEPNTRLNRHYGQSLGKLEAAIDHFNGETLDFVVTLGDVIDRDWDNFDRVLPLYAKLRHAHHFLPGNHDFAVAADRLTEVHDKLGMPAPYHDFALNGVRLILTDGNEVSLFAPPLDDPRRVEAAERLAALTAAGAVNAQSWNAGMGEAQVDWLGERLKAAEQAGERAIVMGHYPLFPQSDHNLWGAEEVSALIAGSPAAIGYFCGHNHVGNYGLLSGTHFVNVKGMVDTPDENAFSIVAVYPDRIELTGFGREQSRTMPL